MNDERPTDLLSSLPRTRPHRRSEKRGAAPAAGKEPASTERTGAKARPGGASKPTVADTAKAEPSAKAKPASPRTRTRKTTRRSADTRLRQPAQPRGIPSTPRAVKRKPAPTTGAEFVGTAVQAVGELAEIGVALGARAIRNALGRLPRP